jgi:alkylation response protein AidB-like acyl-CoA dehydrogenase
VQAGPGTTQQTAPAAGNGRLPSGLPREELDMIATVRSFVDRRVRPVVRELEHQNAYPDALIEEMKAIGLFGMVIPQPFSDGGISTMAYALITAELSRGWMSLAGALGGHGVVSRLITLFGTEKQKERYLRPMATGQVRSAMALTEPSGGSDLQAMRTTALRHGEEYVVNGSKVWITNARHSGLIALLCKTDPDAVPAHRGISILLVEPGQGLEIARDMPKLGYKGVESCQLFFDGYRAPADALLGGAEGHGFVQMMRGLELGRIQVAARALGVGWAAFNDALRYAQERESFGKPIWMHQAIGHYLAEMGTKLLASRLLIERAAVALDAGGRADLEAGMAKLFASESALEVAEMAMRIHGGYGYSPEFDIERYFRDAPLMIVGEGTNEIQKNIIAKQLVSRGGLPEL